MRCAALRSITDPVSRPCVNSCVGSFSLSLSLSLLLRFFPPVPKRPRNQPEGECSRVVRRHPFVCFSFPAFESNRPLNDARSAWSGEKKKRCSFTNLVPLVPCSYVLRSMPPSASRTKGIERFSRACGKDRPFSLCFFLCVSLFYVSIRDSNVEETNRKTKRASSHASIVNVVSTFLPTSRIERGPNRRTQHAQQQQAQHDPARLRS